MAITPIDSNKTNALHENVSADLPDDVTFAVMEDLNKAYEKGRTRATEAFCSKLCTKHGISMEALHEIIEDWNEDHIVHDLGEPFEYDTIERLEARLETGCSRMEQDGNYEPDAKGPLTIVKAKRKPKAKP